MVTYFPDLMTEFPLTPSSLLPAGPFLALHWVPMRYMIIAGIIFSGFQICTSKLSLWPRGKNLGAKYADSCGASTLASNFMAYFDVRVFHKPTVLLASLRSGDMRLH